MFKGKKIKQINNLEIRYTELYQYAVWVMGKYGQCLEDRLTLKQAEECCKNTKDFIMRKEATK